MARVDDYQASFDIAAGQLNGRNLEDVARAAGGLPDQDLGGMSLTYFGRTVWVGGDPLEVKALDTGPALPLAEQALILHYLVRAGEAEPGGEWITFREVEAGEFYWSAFVKRAKEPLVQFFGRNPALLAELVVQVGGTPGGGVGDHSAVVQAFPKVPLLLVLYEGDEEFPPDGNVLLDRTVGSFLSTEDIALTAGLPIYKMMALARQRPKPEDKRAG